MAELEQQLDTLDGQQGLDVASALERLFGPEPVRSAMNAYGSELRAAREAGKLAVTSTGALTAVSSSRRVAAPCVVIKPHRFYGE